MSLDVDLLGSGEERDCICSMCGNKHKCVEREQYYSANITHNLNVMAKEAGIYNHLWRPEEIGVTKARELIEPLRAGLAAMKADPKRFKKFDSPNGWGRYRNFVPWIESYLAACIKFPDANIEVSR